MGDGAHTTLSSEIAGLRTELERQAAVIGRLLDPTGQELEERECGERQELRRQLRALAQRVSHAADANPDPRALRAELATLLCFARTLRADSETWGTALQKRLEQLARAQAATLLEHERLAGWRRELRRRRDALETELEATANRMAHRSGGEWRRTLPVFRLGEGLTLCSITVSRPSRPFRSLRLWLVTLNPAWDEVLVRPG
jgi:hypothetical protein